MIKRDVYLNKLIQSKNNGFPKVITGIRRCGKSYLLTNIFTKYLKENGFSDESILILDLDEIENFKYHDPIGLSNYVLEYSKNKKICYVIIDEIQNVFSILNSVLTNGEHIKAKENDKNIITFANVVLSLSKKTALIYM